MSLLHDRSPALLEMGINYFNPAVKNLNKSAPKNRIYACTGVRIRDEESAFSPIVVGLEGSNRFISNRSSSYAYTNPIGDNETCPCITYGSFASFESIWDSFKSSVSLMGTALLSVTFRQKVKSL